MVQGVKGVRGASNLQLIPDPDMVSIRSPFRLGVTATGLCSVDGEYVSRGRCIGVTGTSGGCAWVEVWKETLEESRRSGRFWSGEAIARDCGRS